MGKASKRKKARRKLGVVATEIVGYYGFPEVGEEVFRRDGGDMVVGSEKALDGYIKADFPEAFGTHSVRVLCFGELLDEMSKGRIYSFDEVAFNRLRKFAAIAGLGVGDLGDFRQHCSVGSDFAVIGGGYAPDDEVEHELCSVISEDEALDKIFGSGDTLPLTDELIKELLSREGNKFLEEDLLGARKIGMEYSPSRNSLILVSPFSDLDAF